MTILILLLKLLSALRGNFKYEVFNLFKQIFGKQKDCRIPQKEHFLSIGNIGRFPCISIFFKDCWNMNMTVFFFS